MEENDLPEWMTHGHTVLCQKDPQKGNTADNCRPITCLPLICKLLTGVIVEEMYNLWHHQGSQAPFKILDPPLDTKAPVPP